MKNVDKKSNILVIHGPNMNLLGIITKDDNKITLDRLNTHLRKTANNLGLKLKIIQSNDEARVVSIIQRMRNKIVGIVLVPGPWQESGYILRDTLQILSIPYITISKEGGPGILKGIQNIYEKDLYKATKIALGEISQSLNIK